MLGNHDAVTGRRTNRSSELVNRRGGPTPIGTLSF